MQKILVTGATGFVGLAVLRQLAGEGKSSLVGTTRQFDIKLPAGCTTANVGELTGDTDWQSALGGVDVVIHCAARVHVLKESAANPLAAFRQVNVQGTLNLARQAVKAGVSRFIFLSTVKVHGEETPPGQSFVASNEPLPMDPYAISKKVRAFGVRSCFLPLLWILRPAILPQNDGGSHPAWSETELQDLHDTQSCLKMAGRGE